MNNIDIWCNEEFMFGNDNFRMKISKGNYK